MPGEVLVDVQVERRAQRPHFQAFQQASTASNDRVGRRCGVGDDDGTLRHGQRAIEFDRAADLVAQRREEKLAPGQALGAAER